MNNIHQTKGRVDMPSAIHLSSSLFYHRKHRGHGVGKSGNKIKILLCTLCVFCGLYLMAPINAAESIKKLELPPLHHVVRLKPSKAIKVPDEFPLNDKGQIDCDTCHGIEDIEDIPFDEVDKEDPKFFRNGPYLVLTDFCYSCHDKEPYERLNIHKQRLDDGSLDEKNCEYCHTEPPDPEKEIRRDELEFRLPPQMLCVGCHLKTPHLNAFNHLVEPDEEKLEQIKEAEKMHQIILPLDDEGKIMCATCHSPHEPGVIPKDKPAGRQVADASVEDGVSYVDHEWNDVFSEDKQERLDELNKHEKEPTQLSYQRIESEVLLRLPAKDGTLCLACHSFEEERNR